MASEDHIITSVLAGNTGEFRKLVEQYRRPLFRFTYNIIRDEHDAEDLTQEVFVAAFDHLASYNKKRASLLTWLLTIARNRCVNYLKRKRPIVDGESVSGTEQTASTSESARHEFWRCLDDALDTLPVEQKTAFILAEVEGLSYAEIAQVEQTTVGTVKSRIYRAKQRLQSVMAPVFGEN